MYMPRHTPGLQVPLISLLWALAYHFSGAILSKLGEVDATDEEDVYDIAKALDISQCPEENEEIQDEEARMRGEHDGDDAWVPAAKAPDDDLSDSESDGDLDEEGGNKDIGARAGKDDVQRQRLRGLDPAQKPFEDATLSFSKKGKVRLPDVLPTYVQLRAELQEARNRLQKMHGPGNDPYGHLAAISAGEQKLEKNFALARQSDLTLVASILHPGMRLQYFENTLIWGEMMQRGRILIEHLFETYNLELEQPLDTRSANPQATRPKLQKLSWSDRLRQARLSSVLGSALGDELERFFGNVYAYQPDMNIL
ncbi:hypothetical protein FRC08_000542 [Ceratobasidium sp. 394]|nr:hypothetical protein FRC08_000542 [Ceratobasidium sp. 394]KAG9095552.1 hypothetical protein FS749_010234 [Ceratobasidium sp. UAMH 11750]